MHNRYVVINKSLHSDESPLLVNKQRLLQCDLREVSTKSQYYSSFTTPLSIRIQGVITQTYIYFINIYKNICTLQVSSTAALPPGTLKRLGDIKNVFFSSKEYSYHSCSPRLALFCPQKIHDFLESMDFTALCRLLQQKGHHVRFQAG